MAAALMWDWLYRSLFVAGACGGVDLAIRRAKRHPDPACFCGRHNLRYKISIDRQIVILSAVEWCAHPGRYRFADWIESYCIRPGCAYRREYDPNLLPKQP